MKEGNIETDAVIALQTIAYFTERIAAALEASHVAHGEPEPPTDWIDWFSRGAVIRALREKLGIEPAEAKAILENLQEQGAISPDDSDDSVVFVVAYERWMKQ